MAENKPWLSEPNEFDFVDERTGYPIALRRHPRLGHWNGYVGVPADHPWHEKTYQDIETMADYPCVHGGLTFSAGQEPFEKVHSATWWFGFACDHAGDLVPRLERYWLPEDFSENYRTIEYAKNEAIALAAQLAAVAPKKTSILDINKMFG